MGEKTIGVTAAAMLPSHANAATTYSFMRGDFKITVLSDGFITIPSDILWSDGTPDQRASVLPRVDTIGGMVKPETNIPLIRKGEDAILIDIGAGRRYQPSDGMLTDNLKLARIDPESVTKVVFSHAHPDHIWATLNEDESPRFPKATYYVGAAEWDFWMDPDYLAKMPAVLGAAKDRTMLLGYHWAYPGVGFAERNGAAFRFTRSI